MASDFLEKDLEAIIYENRHRIHERGLPKLYANCAQQYYLPSGLIIDLFCWEIREEVCYIQIWELKKGAITKDAYFQIVGYYTEYLRIIASGDFLDFKIDLYLVGSECVNDVWYAAFLGNNLHVYRYSYDYDGITFHKDSFTLDETKADESIKAGKPEYELHLKTLRKTFE